MSEQEKKQVKLVEVYNQLNTIKNQLRAMISPAHHQQSQHFHFDKNNFEKTFEKRREVRGGKKEEQCLVGRDGERGRGQRKGVSREGEGMAHHNGINSPQTKNNKEKIFFNTPNIKTQTYIQNNYTGQTTRRAAERLRNELRCMPKIQFSPPKKQAKDTTLQPQKKQVNPAKKHTHTRHATLCEPSQLKPSNSPTVQIAKDTNFISDKRTPHKQGIVFAKSKEAIRENENKKLMRMKSDFTGFKKLAEKEIQKQKVPSISDKVRELQQEVKKKDEAIEVLFVELSQIEKSFKEMEQILWNILGQYGGLQRAKEVDICQGLKEVLRDIELQNDEVGRLNVQCQYWRKLNMQQEQKLHFYDKKLSSLGKSQESMTNLKHQTERYKNEAASLASKLEVSVNENRLKDEFIVKFLTTRNTSETVNSSWISQVLQQYLKTCNYPKNCLLQKLREEQMEIERLRAELLSKSSETKIT